MPQNKRNQKQMNDEFIFNPLQDTTKTTTEQTDKFYGFIDCCDYIDNENYPRTKTENTNTLAKITYKKNGSIKYSIKITKNGKMHNPTLDYDNKKDNNFLDRICRSNDSFKEVSYKVFNMYINFLKTKNVAWINNAERESE